MESAKRWIDKRGSYVPLVEKKLHAITPWMAIIRQRGIDWLPPPLLTPDAQSKSHTGSFPQKVKHFFKGSGQRERVHGQHIDLQLPCVSNLVYSNAFWDQSVGRTHFLWFRESWIRFGFEGSLPVLSRKSIWFKTWSPAFDLSAWGCTYLSRLKSTQEIIINNSVLSSGYVAVKQPIDL